MSPIAYEAPKEPHVWAAIRKGSGAISAKDTTPYDPSRPAIIGGLQFNMPRLYREIRDKGGRYAFIDRAPINGGRGSGIYRVIPNAYHCNWIEDRPIDRLQRFRGKVRPWRGGGSHILVCASSVPCNEFWDRPDWIEETLAVLVRHTDRPIRVRRKGDAGALEDALNGAFAVVSFLSMSAVDAAMLGVPVFVDPANPAAPVGLTDLSKIETPVYPDRERWAATLAYWQFTIDEMASGYAWNRVLERL